MKNYLKNEELDILINTLDKEQLNQLYKNIIKVKNVNLILDSFFQYFLGFNAVFCEISCFYQLFTFLNGTPAFTNEHILLSFIDMCLAIVTHNYLENEKKDLRQEFCLNDLKTFCDYIKLNKNVLQTTINNISQATNKELKKTI